MIKGTTTIGKGLRKAAMGFLGLGLLALSACAIKEGNTDPDDGEGVVVSVTDTSTVSLDFNDATKKVFTESAEFDLVKLRDRIDEKGIDLSSIRIVGLVVTYDAATKQFLTDNEGLKYVLRIYTNSVSDTGKGRLTLETFGATHANVPTLDPDQVLFELNKHLFAHPDGMPDLLEAIQDETISKMRVTAELEVLDPLKKTGKLNLNLVIDVAGKV